MIKYSPLQNGRIFTLDNSHIDGSTLIKLSDIERYVCTYLIDFVFTN